MPTSPSFYVNSPTAGTEYTANSPAYEFVPDNASSVTVTVKTWTGSNGTGSLVAVSTLTAIARNVTGSSDASSNTASGANTSTVITSSGANGSNVFCAAGKYTGSTPGSLEMYATYSGSPVAQAYLNTGDDVTPVWTPATVYVNTGTPSSPVWTQADSVSVNTGTPSSPTWVPNG